MQKHTSIGIIIFLQKFFQAISGLIILLMLTHFLSPLELGYYYTIGSLLSCYVILDFGLSNLLVHTSARLSHGLSINRMGVLLPRGEQSFLFEKMIANVRGWYGKVSFFLLLLIPAGFFYLSQPKNSHDEIVWIGPWLFSATVAAFSVFASPALAIIEGFGAIKEVYLVRISQLIFSVILYWVLLEGGFGLWVSAIPLFVFSLLTYGWLWIRYRPLFFKLYFAGTRFQAPAENWVLQGRVAASTLANYLFLNAPILIIFNWVGAKSAGQVGLSIVVANLVGSLCASWLIARTPDIIRLSMRGNKRIVRVLFIRYFLWASFFSLVCYGLLFLVKILLVNWVLLDTLLDPFEMALLFGSFMIINAATMLSVYYRAYKMELLAAPLLISVVISTLIACLVVNEHKVIGVLASFFITLFVICVPAFFYSWSLSDKFLRKISI